MKPLRLYFSFQPNLFRLFLQLHLSFFLLFSTIAGAQQFELKRQALSYEIPELKGIRDFTHILQDRNGFIWMGTLNGLYRFDGYNVVHYAFDPANNEGIAGNWISGLAEDDSGNIWFSVFGIGLQKLDPVLERFTLYRANENDAQALPDNKIEYLGFTNGLLWLATQQGLCHFTPETGKFKRYSNKYYFSFFISGNTFWAIQRNKLATYDSKLDSLIFLDSLRIESSNARVFGMAKGDDLYISANGKIFIYNIKTKTLRLFELKDVGFIQQVYFFDNRLLIWAPPNVLKVVDIETGTAQTQEISTAGTKEEFFIATLLKLKNGDVWMLGDKAYKIIFGNNGIESYDLVYGETKMSPTTPSLYSEWEKGLLGMGKSLLLDFNLSKVYPAKLQHPALAPLADATNWETRYIISYQDENKDDWIALFERSNFGISFYKYSFLEKKLIRLGTSRILPGTIFGLTKIGDNLWLAGWVGLLRWNIPTGQHFLIQSGADSTRLSSGGLRSCFKDNEDGLWVGTQNGLNYKKKGQDYFAHYLARPGDTTALSFNTISVVTQDSTGLIWVGTLGGGLNSYNMQTGKFTWYTTKQGLADNNIGNILIDDYQDIWVSHDQGISRINRRTKLIENFAPSDGVRSYFGEQTAVKMKDGSLVFVGDGFNRLWPEKIRIESPQPKILLTNFKLFNQDVKIDGQDSILQQHIRFTKSITLKHNQNVITIQYAAVDMTFPEYRTYAYQLKGFDTGWQYVGNKREVTYTNLSSGEYIFKVKSADRSGHWNEMESALEIIILPPWWHTWWAYTIYTLVFLVAIWGFIRFRSRTLKKENLKLEAKVERRTDELNQSLRELKETQSQLIQREKMASLGELTAGIAHEIQNPLNFVNNFSEINTELIGEMQGLLQEGNTTDAIPLSNDLAENELKILHHGRRAETIVKGMLQHSRAGTGQKELVDINMLADEYFRLSYHGFRAKDKSFNVELQCDFDSTIDKVKIVPQDIGRVLLNLYNNAFYATHERGKREGEGFQPVVTIRTLKANEKIEIHVRDNGNGIPSSILEKIFQPFFTTKPPGDGTGLGLSLSYDIIRAHGGEIRVQSRDKEGAEFIIQLPEK